MMASWNNPLLGPDLFNEEVIEAAISPVILICAIKRFQLNSFFFQNNADTFIKDMIYFTNLSDIVTTNCEYVTTAHDKTPNNHLNKNT